MSWTNIERIIHYLDEEITEEEKMIFEKDLELDDELKKDFLLFKTTKSEVQGLDDIHEAIKDPDLDEALKLANDTLSEYFEEKAKSQIPGTEVAAESNTSKTSGARIKKLYRILLPLAAALLIGIFIKIVFLTPSAEDLYAKYYSQAKLGYSNLRGDESDSHSVYALSNLYYLEKEYQKADSVLNLSGKDIMESPDYFFFNGIIKMGLGSFEEASLSFENYLDLHNEMQLETEWYLSLCYVKLNRLDQAEQILEDLNTHQNSYQGPSGKLLRDIRRLKK